MGGSNGKMERHVLDQNNIQPLQLVLYRAATRDLSQTMIIDSRVCKQADQYSRGNLVLSQYAQDIYMFMIVGNDKLML